MMSAEVQRAVEEVQASLVIAKRFPRDVTQAMNRLNAACDQLSVAESAEYTYNRGGSAVRGASIRLAEVMLQCWGNVDSAVRELTRSVDARGVPYSEVEVFTWDKETNVKDSKQFQVTHVRHTRSGSTTLTDSRDVYEHIANQAARRKRSTILAIIPQYVQDAAVERCRATVKEHIKINADTVTALVKSFAEYKVKKGHIEAFLDHPLTVQDLTRDEYLNLRNIYTAIRDGMQKPADFFEAIADEQKKADEDMTGALADEALADPPARKKPRKSRATKKTPEGEPTKPDESEPGVQASTIPAPHTLTLEDMIDRASDASANEILELAASCGHLTAEQQSELTKALAARSRELEHDADKKAENANTEK